MNYTEKRREHLRKAAGWAEKVRVDLGDVMLEHQGRVHFRPSSQGVAMIGLLPERPQRGKGGIRDLQRLAREFESLFRRHCVDVVKRKQKTPEKRLQSWLVSHAIRHGRQICLPGGDSERTETLLFITDELPLDDDDGKKIQCDLLAFRTADGETGVPVVIELKSEREKKRLIDQVAGFASLVEEHAEDFEHLYGAVLGHDVLFTAPPEQWVVWPPVTGHPGRAASEFEGWGIKVIRYVEDGDGYRFVAN